MNPTYNFGAPFHAVSAGALLGTTGSQAIIDSINNSLGSTKFFGTVKDSYREIGNYFINNIVKPINYATMAIANSVNTLLHPDVIKPITQESDLLSIPPCMYEPIVMFQPVRTLLEEGRIFGFGYEPDNLPKEDVWGRLIQNGTCEDIKEALATSEDGCVELDYEWYSTDPEHTVDDIDAVEQTRNFILKMMQTTNYDPTDYPEVRG